MEDWKERIPMILAVIIVLILMVGAIYLLFIQKTEYYVKVDNNQMEQVSNSDDMKYEYTLTAYSKSGKAKEIQFKTSRQLREGAYLELDFMFVRGVVEWREIQADNLPDKVKTEMNVE